VKETIVYQFQDIVATGFALRDDENSLENLQKIVFHINRDGDDRYLCPFEVSFYAQKVLNISFNEKN
jgi:hypothetical protein